MDKINFVDNWVAGLDAEQIVREIVKKEGHRFGQLDLVSICKRTGKIFMYEVKHQERFDGYPFEGHGLPPWQVEFRIELAEKTGMIPLLIIVEKPSGRVFYQNLFDLEKGEKFKTKTGKRVVYPLTSFKEYEL